MIASSLPAMPPCDGHWGESSGRLKVTPVPTLVLVEDASEAWGGEVGWRKEPGT